MCKSFPFSRKNVIISLRKETSMNNYEKIINLAINNNGYVTTKMVVKKGIAKMFLTNLVKTDKLERIDRGLYILPNEFPDEYYKLQLANKEAIFSLATALYFHNLSDRIPHIIDATVSYNYAGNLLKNKNISLIYVNKDILNLGVIEIETSFGNKIKVYDVEKTICDVIKNQSKVDAEIFTRALQKYVTLKHKDLYKLHKYAKEMNIEDKVNEYMKVLL